MSQRNNVNKKSTNGRAKSSVLSRPQAEVRAGRGKLPRKVNNNGGQRSVAAAYSRTLGISKMSERIGPGGSRTLKFKEFVQDIAGSVLFTANLFPVNPGIPTLFAWLSGQALFYQEYRFRNIRFIFETEKSTSTSGRVMYAFQQDATDPVPAGKQEMLENQFKAGGAPWEAFTLDVGRSVPFALGKSRFIRFGTLAANLDLKTYDIGQLVVATQGMADATSVGELYVEYEVDLMTPIVSSLQLASALSKTFSGSTPSSVSIYGAAPSVAGSGSLDIAAAVNTITFNRVGRYLVENIIVGTGLFTAFAPVLTASTGTVTISGGNSNAAANNGTSAICSHTVVITARGQTAVFDCSTIATTVTASSCKIAGFSTT